MYLCVCGRAGVADLRIAAVQELKPKIEMERKVCVCVTDEWGEGRGQRVHGGGTEEDEEPFSVLSNGRKFQCNMLELNSRTQTCPVC